MGQGSRQGKNKCEITNLDVVLVIRSGGGRLSLFQRKDQLENKDNNRLNALIYCKRSKSRSKIEKKKKKKKKRKKKREDKTITH